MGGVPPAVGPYALLWVPEWVHGESQGEKRALWTVVRLQEKEQNLQELIFEVGSKHEGGQASPELPRLTVRRSKTSHANSLNGTAMGIWSFLFLWQLIGSWGGETNRCFLSYDWLKWNEPVQFHAIWANKVILLTRLIFPTCDKKVPIHWCSPPFCLHRWWRGTSFMVEQSLTLAVAFDFKQNDIRPVDK